LEQVSNDLQDSFIQHNWVKNKGAEAPPELLAPISAQ